LILAGDDEPLERVRNEKCAGAALRRRRRRRQTRPPSCGAPVVAIWREAAGDGDARNRTARVDLACGGDRAISTLVEPLLGQDHDIGRLAVGNRSTARFVGAKSASIGSDAAACSRRRAVHGALQCNVESRRSTGSHQRSTGGAARYLGGCAQGGKRLEMHAGTNALTRQSVRLGGSCAPP